MGMMDQNFNMIELEGGKVHFYCLNNEFHPGKKRVVLSDNLLKETVLTLMGDQDFRQENCQHCGHSHAFSRHTIESLKE